MGRRRFGALVVAAGLVAAACSGSDAGDDRTADSVVATSPSEGDDVATTDAEPPETSTADTAAPDTDPPATDPPSTAGDDPPVDGVADWTVLVYVMGDNDLEPFAVLDLLEMAEVSDTDRLNIVALTDRHPAYTLDDDPFGDFTDTKFLEVRGGDVTEFGEFGELNVGAPETLAAFIETGITSYPAEHYGVVLWNHGAGWPGMGPDETDGNDILDLADIDQGFTDGLLAAGIESVDLVGFDACLMASYEVASVMADHADYMIASEELEPGHGWNYAALDVIAQNPEASPAEVGQAIIDGFAAQAVEAGTDEEITLSLVDLGAMDELTGALAALADPLMAEPQVAAPLLARAQADAPKYGSNPDPSIDSHHVDLGRVVETLGGLDPVLAEPAGSVLDVIGSMVVSTTAGPATQDATGLSIYFPPYADVFRQGYLNLAGVEVWPDLLTSFYTAGQALPEEQQADFVPTGELAEGEAEYFFDEDGLNIFGFFDLAAADNIVEAEIFYGVLDENDGSIIYIGEEPGEVATDGSGLAAAIYDLTVLTISDGIDTDYAYLDLEFDEESGVVTIDVPLWYLAPEDIGTDALPQDVVLSLVLDLDFNILSEVYYRIDPDGTAGELSADPNGLIFPVVLNEYPDGSLEWLTLSEQGLFANLPDLQYDLEPLEPGTGLYAELVIRDYGGNTSSVSMFDLVPG